MKVERYDFIVFGFCRIIGLDRIELLGLLQKPRVFLEIEYDSHPLSVLIDQIAFIDHAASS